MKSLYLSISDVTVFLTHFPRIVILLLEKSSRLKLTYNL